MKMSKPITVLSLVLILSLSLGAFACGPAAPAAPVAGGDVNIGIAYSTSGPVGQLGLSLLKGVQMGIQAFNDTYGGVKADGKVHTVKTIVYNNNSDPQQGISNTTRLITQDKTPIIIGDFTSGVALAQAPVIDDNKWPWITNAANPKLTGPEFKYANRFGQNDTYNMPLYVKELAELMGAKRKLAVLASKTDFSAAKTAMFIAEAPRAGFQLVFQESFDNAATDFYAIIDKVKTNNPDLVYISGYASIGTCIKQSIEKGFKPQWLIDDTFLQDVKGVLGASGIGVYLLCLFNPQDTVSDAAKIYAKYAPPTIPGMAFNLDYAGGFETGFRACLALQKAGTIAADPASRDKIATALRTLDFQGMYFFGVEDEVGNTRNNPRILQVTNAEGGLKMVAENGKAVR
jgi:branched-chain amino acid transport system substrate-binding protein